MPQKGSLAVEFSEKYELLQSVTTGAVESFVAQNKARGERVLVHILQCEPQKPNQPTVQWVLEGFRKVAPEPAGTVLETGHYSGTLYAYVVTTLPDDATLNGWVQRYQAQSQEPQGIPAPAKSSFDSESGESAAESESPAHQKPGRPAQVPVQFTQFFRELDSQAKPVAPGAPVVAAPNEIIGEPLSPLAELPRSMPSANQERFPSAVHAAPNWDEVIPKSSPAANEDLTHGGSMQSSVPDSPSTNFPAETETPEIRNALKPGEFTNFFQSPLRVDGPAEIPAVSPLAPDLQKKPGEFTLMFRSGSAAPEAPVFAPEASEQDPSRSGMTGWATHAEIMAQGANDPASVPMPPLANEAPAVVVPPVKDRSVSPQPRPTMPSALPNVPAPPVFPLPVHPKPNAVPIAPAMPSATDAATSAFRPAVSVPVAPAPSTPAGPSAYTQIISGKRSLAPEPAEAEEQPALKLPSFTAPSKPAMPAMPPPPLPKGKPTPKTAPPALKAPKVEVSKLDAAKPPVSYWPLVLTLTVLFFIAVLLVLYFVLKH